MSSNSNNTTASFLEFEPEEYLREYYDHIGRENDTILQFLAKSYKGFEPASQRILELGGGPTVYQLISAAEVAREIHFSDYLEANLKEIESWLAEDSRAFAWDIFAERALAHEVGTSPEMTAVKARLQTLKRKITKLLICNAFNQDPLLPTVGKYDIVSTHFVAESITENKEEWSVVLGNITSLVKINGWLIMSGLIGAKFWQIGGSRFTATNISGEDVKSLLDTLGFKIVNFEVVNAEQPTSDKAGQGYAGIFLVKARLLAK